MQCYAALLVNVVSHRIPWASVPECVCNVVAAEPRIAVNHQRVDRNVAVTKLLRECC